MHPLAANNLYAKWTQLSEHLIEYCPTVFPTWQSVMPALEEDIDLQLLTAGRFNSDIDERLSSCMVAANTTVLSQYSSNSVHAHHRYKNGTSKIVRREFFTVFFFPVGT